MPPEVIIEKYQTRVLKFWWIKMFSIRITSRKIWYRSLHTKPPAAVFLEMQKEHSISLYSLSVTTANPLVYSIFANRHNYLKVKYNLNYAMDRTFALRSVGRCGNASGYVEITIRFHNMRLNTYWHISKINFVRKSAWFFSILKWA